MIPKDGGYPQNKRYVKPDEGEKYCSLFDFGSQELLDLDQRRDSAYKVYTIDLGVQPVDQQTGLAGAPFLEIIESGRAFSGYFYKANDALRTPVGGLLLVATQKAPSVNLEQFPLKNGRAVRCDFTRLYLKWANQTDTDIHILCDLVIYKYNSTPVVGSI